MTHVFPLIALHKIFYNSFFKKIAICTFLITFFILWSYQVAFLPDYINYLLVFRMSSLYSVYIS